MARGKKAGAPKQKMEGISIKWKLILIIVPVVFVLLVALALILSKVAEKDISTVTDDKMKATLDAKTNGIDGQMAEVQRSCRTIAEMVANTYTETSIDSYGDALSDVVKDNDIVLGAGLWFEPNVFDPNEKYMGPYWYKDGNEIVEDWEYSNADYDYFSQEYYTNAQNMSSMDAVITNPYFDESSGTIMASCSSPILKDGEYMGCVTVDLLLSSVQAEIEEITVGKTGTVWFADSDGNYIYHPADADAMKNGMNLSDSSELSEYTSKILSDATGEGTFKWEKKTRRLYWDSLNTTGWKMGLTIEEDEIDEAVKNMNLISIVVLLLAVIISTTLIVWQASGIANVMNKVRAFAGELADGNFTIDKLAIKRKDEIGEMAKSLNMMYENNSGVIQNIGVGSGKVNSSSGQLSETATDLTSRFQEITANMERVNDAMSNTGAATEQVSASANEVNESVQRLAEETAKTKEEAVAIEERAADIEKDGREANAYAIRIAKERGEELTEAAKQAEVVHKIGTLADSIADIASQINLLSLNASIEAARAGEHGRGFAVVASEINSLATETRTAVDEIQETVSGIQDAFETLNNSAMDLLTFVQETVTPDYSRFTEIGHQYGEDAKMFGELADSISEMVSYISDSMDQVNAAVASIAESATETATSSSDVTDTMSEVEGMVERVSDMAGEQLGVAENLDDIVKQFKFDNNDFA